MSWGPRIISLSTLPADGQTRRIGVVGLVLVALGVLGATVLALLVFIPLVFVFAAIVGVWLLWRRMVNAVTGWRQAAPGAKRRNVRVIGRTKNV